MNVLLRALKVVLVGLGSMLAISAHAAVIQSSFGFVVATGSFFDGSTPFAECQRGNAGSCSAADGKSVVGTFTKFDPSLGTLTGIQVTLDSIFPLGTEIFGFGDGGTASAAGASSYDVGGIFSGTLDAPSSACTPFCNVFTNQGTATPGTQDFDLDLTAVLAPALFPGYLGADPGSMTILQTISVAASSDTGGLIARARTNNLFIPGWRGTVTLAYTFDAVKAVPEPTSVALLGASLGGVWVTLRGRRQRAARVAPART